MNETLSTMDWHQSKAAPPAMDSLEARSVRSPVYGMRAFAKAFIDRFVALVLLIFVAPLFVSIAILIILDTGFPVFFTQPRYGRDGKVFRILKFRTLHRRSGDVSGANQVKASDPRVTRIGRFLRASSVDELPQLLNVLRGDMSLVGPRPHPIGMRTEGLTGEEVCPGYMDRYLVKPGMTGWAQVNGRRGPTRTVQDLVERVDYDRAYIAQWSLLLDLKIILMTPRLLFTSEGS